jgi:hypothetical protein
MIIQWLQETTLSVTSDYDEETDTANDESVTFNKWEKSDVDVVDDRENHVDIQFGNGSMAFNVFKGLYQRME